MMRPLKIKGSVLSNKLSFELHFRFLTSLLFIIILFTHSQSAEAGESEIDQIYNKLGWTKKQVQKAHLNESTTIQIEISKKKEIRRKERLMNQKKLAGSESQINRLWGEYVYGNVVDTDELTLDAKSTLQNKLDPYEEINMETLRLNNSYRSLIMPPSDSYNEGEKVNWVGERLYNFSNYLEDVLVNLPISALYLLGGDVGTFAGAIGRIVINLGGLGMWDFANKIGTNNKTLKVLERKDRGIDELLRKLGFPCGNYQVIPFIGPSTTRGTSAAVLKELIYSSLSGGGSTIVSIVRVAGQVHETFGDIEMSKHLYRSRDTDFRPAETDKYKEKKLKCDKDKLTNKECGLDKFSNDERVIYMVIRAHKLSESQCFDDTDITKTMERLYRADPEKYHLDEEDMEDIEDLGFGQEIDQI